MEYDGWVLVALVKGGEHLPETGHEEIDAHKLPDSALNAIEEAYQRYIGGE